MFRFFQPEKTNDAHYTVLMNDLHQTAQDLQDAYRNLENVIDPDMIDCCIYELYSVQMRYKFLLASIKKIEDSYTKNPLEVSNPDTSQPNHFFHTYIRHKSAGYYA